MKKLRQIHLYLGAFFAPILLFFTVSGIWQTLGWNDHSNILRWLSTIHKNHGLKGMPQLNSGLLAAFVIVMSVGLGVSIVTGVIMAFKFGRGPITFYSLLAGFLIPLLIIFILAR